MNNVFFTANKITEAQGKVTDTTLEAPTNYHGSLNGRHQVVILTRFSLA